MELEKIKLSKTNTEISVKLREEITGDDWERWQRLDNFYSQLEEDGQKNSQLFLKMNREVYNTLVRDVLVDENNELVPVDLIKQIPITKSLPMVINFFLVYNQLSKDILKSLEKSGVNSNRLTGTSKDSGIE